MDFMHGIVLYAHIMQHRGLGSDVPGIPDLTSATYERSGRAPSGLRKLVRGVFRRGRG